MKETEEVGALTRREKVNGYKTGSSKDNAA